MKDEEKRMMDEEYGKDLGGCAWMIVAFIVAIVGAGIWLFTR